MNLASLFRPFSDAWLSLSGRRHRRAWVGPRRAHIEIRAVHRPGCEAVARDIERALERLEGVRWAEVNAVVGRVVVAFDDEQLGLDDLVDVVQGVEEAHEVHEERFPHDRAEHPGDVEPLRRHLVAMAADVVGLGASAVGQVLRLTPLPVELLAVIALADAEPRVRRVLEAHLGAPVADVGLALANAIGQGLAQGWGGLVVDLATRSTLASEVQERRRAWARRERELYPGQGEAPIEAVAAEPRPRPLPSGPIETYSDRAALVSLGASGAALAATRDPRRTAAVVLAAVPRAARLGREAFAAQLGRLLAARGVIALDARALRRLDRIDTVVVDAASCTNDTWVAHDAVPLGRVPHGQLLERAAALLDPTDPTAVRHSRGGAWRLGPLPALGARTPLDAGARAKELAGDGGQVLGLAHHDEVVGLVSAVVELDELAPALADAARRAGHTLVVAGTRGGVARRLGVERVVAGEGRLHASVRELQAEGRGVLLVSARRSAALRAADCGVGVLRHGRRPPWGADLLSGPGLAEACLVVEATGPARVVSRRSALLALSASGLAGALTLLGSRRTAARRALIPVNASAILALTVGTWEGWLLDRRPAPLPVDSTPWHALSPTATLRRLHSSPEGLSVEEAARRRRERPAAEDVPSEGNLLTASVEELATPLTPVLAGGAGLSAAVGSLTDAVLICGVLAVNALIGGFQRVAADRAVAGLLHTTAVRARVRRGSDIASETSDLLVPGDIVTLGPGDLLAADCRLVEATGLEVDESSLTGESLPVRKTAEATPTVPVADRRCMAYEGTTVVAGTGTAVIVATGRGTEVGRSLVASGERAPATGVETRLGALTRITLPVSLGAGAFLTGFGLLRGRSPRETVATGVSLAAAAVPEGLPMVATVAQLAAARRLSARQALVRHPRTIEALGRVDVLCFDKTGTLTEGRIRLQRVSDGAVDEAPDHLAPPRRAVLAAALRATPPASPGVPLPHPTDQAVVDGAAAAGVTVADGVPGWEAVQEIPFSPDRGFHAVLGRTQDARAILSVKGAPEVVMPRCRRWRRDDGIVPLGAAVAEALGARVERLARQGLRVLAVAEAARELGLAAAGQGLQDEGVAELELLGLLGLADEVRPAAADAIADLRRAGVDVSMITGDHPSTAEAIAAELEILNGRQVLTGAELDASSDERLDELVRKVSVFARVTPAHKVRIVRAYQRAGRAVAMTGDGANDAPAIRLADVGVALGRRGTPAAREAADLVVTDDALETIIAAIVEGRAMWASVRDALSILLGGNLGEIGFTVTAGMLAGASPLTARQLLLVNLLTDMLPAMAVALRPPARTSPQALLREGPEVSLGAALSRDIMVRAAATASAALGAWVIARPTGTAARARTVALTALVGAQLGQTWALGVRNPLVAGTSVVSAGALVVVVQTPGLSHAFGCRPLGPAGWTIAASAASVATAAGIVAPWLLDLLGIDGEPATATAGAGEGEGEARAIDKRSALHPAPSRTERLGRLQRL